MKKSTKVFRSVMCGTLAFLLSVSLMLISSLLVLKFTALNPDYLISILSRSNYSESLKDELKNEFVSYGAACNINEDFFDTVFKEIITAQQIDNDTEVSIRDFYKNQVETNAEYSEIKDKLFEALKVYAVDNGYRINEGTLANLEIIAEELTGVYNAYVGIFKASYFATAADLLSRYMPVVNYALIGIAVFAVITAVVIRLSFKKAKNWLRYFIYASSGTTLMLFTAPAIACVMKIGSKVNIANASLYGLVSGFINNLFVSFIIASVVLAVITVILHLLRASAVKKKR